MGRRFTDGGRTDTADRGPFVTPPPLTEEQKDRLFHYWLRVEQDHAAHEREACRTNRHDLAAIAHACRWRCLDNALAIAEDRPQDVR